jgi:hypothetical protein
MATSPNFNWPEPDNTDLVKNGALAIRTAVDAIDSSMVDLKGGTTGQVLAKATNTDMDFTWTTASSAPSVNLLLNSNFALNQRVYVSGANLASGSYGFDRWKSNYTNTTLTFTASTQGQSVTINASGGLQQIIEQGLVPAGTYTLSWTGTATARVYNSGGTPPSYAASPVTFTADGTANVVVEFTASGSTKTLSKVQFNAGTSTTWALATPTLQTELAACQRYFYRIGGDLVNDRAFGVGVMVTTTIGKHLVSFPVTMRTAPSVSTAAASNFYMYGGAAGAIPTALALSSSTTQNTSIDATRSATTANTVSFLQALGTANAFFDLSSEL